MPADAVEIEPGLIEIDYGEWDGLTAEECLQHDPELRRAWIADPYHTRCPDGESGEDVARRAFAVFHEVEAWLADDRARCAIVVAHNHVNRLRLCALLAWAMRDYRRRVAQDPAGYSLISYGAGLPGVRRVNAPATVHLPSGD
jgi:broad specificity phosphatase PhoE